MALGELLVSGAPVVSFKRDVYRRVMKEFAVTVMPMQSRRRRGSPRLSPKERLS